MLRIQAQNQTSLLYLTAELHNLLESIKSISYVTSLEWSEMVEMIGDNSPSVITAFFNNSRQRHVRNRDLLVH
jgi:hypothetical protein